MFPDRQWNLSGLQNLTRTGKYSQPWVLRGLNHQKSLYKNFWVYVYATLLNVTVDVMIIVISTVGAKCAPGCIRMHHFEGENTRTRTKSGRKAPAQSYSTQLQIFLNTMY